MAVLPKPWADSMQADSEPLEDAMLYLRLDPVVLGGRRDSVEGGFEGKTDHDALREVRADSSSGSGEGLG